MDYKKAYSEALERANKFYEANTNEGYRQIFEEIFPELKESEDNRIRRAIRNLVLSVEQERLSILEITQSDVIAWLEKQATPQVRTGIEWVNTIDDACDKLYAEEYAHGEYCHEQSFKWGFQEGVEWLERQGSQKLANTAKTCKDEPKFKVGDWVISAITKEVEQVIELTGCEYICSGHLIVSFNNQHLLKRWTIKDAKDGDVLVASDGSIFLFKGVVDDGCKHYIALTTDNTVKFNEGLKHYWETSNAVYPATKEQRDLLFRKMKEAGYEWDAEKKELKKIEQNPAWSEEDIATISRVISIVKWATYSDHSHPILNDEGATELVERLNSLKERYTWKPSDEHYELKEFAKIVRGNLTGISKDVQELFEAKYLQLTGNKMYGGYKD